MPRPMDKELPGTQRSKVEKPWGKIYRRGQTANEDGFTVTADLAWCLTSTYTIRLIRYKVWGGEGGLEGGKREII